LRVRIVAEAFRGQSRIARHRVVNGLLAGEIARGLHALAIEAKAPGE
jgi:BolA protein